MTRRKDLCPILIVYFEEKAKGFPKRIPLYFMNDWFERNQWPKMVILAKIVKIGQLQMSVESREPIMHSGFFRLKHTYIIGKQKKLYIKGFLWQLSSKKIPK